MAKAKAGPMEAVHVQTTIQTVFGAKDAGGNIVYKQTMSVDVPVLTAAAFAGAHQAIVRGKDEYAAKLPEQAGAQPDVPPEQET